MTSGIRANGSVSFDFVDAFVRGLGYDPKKVVSIEMDHQAVRVATVSDRPGLGTIETSHYLLTDEQSERRGA